MPKATVSLKGSLKTISKLPEGFSQVFLQWMRSEVAPHKHYVRFSNTGRPIVADKPQAPHEWYKRSQLTVVMK